jgi:uncharacterized membrane protein
MKDKNNFHPFAALTILFWSVAYVLTRLTLRWFSAFSLGFLRYFAAACALAVIVLAAKIKPPGKADFKWVALSGFFGFFLYMIAFNQGCRTVSAATASVIIATVPVFTALLARCFYGEKTARLPVGSHCGRVLRRRSADDAGRRCVSERGRFVAAARRRVARRLQPAAAASDENLFVAPVRFLQHFCGRSHALRVCAAGRAGGRRRAARAVCIHRGSGRFFKRVRVHSLGGSVQARKANVVREQLHVHHAAADGPARLCAYGESPDLATTAGGAVILAGMVLFNFGSRIRRKARKEKGSGI